MAGDPDAGRGEIGASVAQHRVRRAVGDDDASLEDHDPIDQRLPGRYPMLDDNEGGSRLVDDAGDGSAERPLVLIKIPDGSGKGPLDPKE